MTNTERAIDYVQRETQWKLEDITILNEETMEWIVYATTTHNTKRGDPEISFIVLGKGENHITYDANSLPALVDWCQRQLEVGRGRHG